MPRSDSYFKHAKTLLLISTAYTGDFGFVEDKISFDSRYKYIAMVSETSNINGHGRRVSIICY